jgi:hypothetical protein
VQLLSLGKAGDGMMKAEGADRALEVMGGDWKGVRASAALARLVGQIEYHLVQVVLEGLILGVLFVELDAGLQAGRYLLLQGRVVLDPGVLAAEYILAFRYAWSWFTRRGMTLRISPTWSELLNEFPQVLLNSSSIEDSSSSRRPWPPPPRSAWR